MDEQTLKDLHKSVGVHEVELHLLRALLWEVVATREDRDRILQNFIRSADAMSATAPKGTDPEFLVELRSRARSYVDAMRQPPGTN